jgi:hypothetical protein
VLRERTDLPGEQRALREAIVCHNEALTLAPKDPVFRERAARDFDRAANLALEQGDYAAAVAHSEEHLSAVAERMGGLYRLAVTYSAAIGLVGKDSTLAESRRAELTRAYTDRAVACLRELRPLNPLLAGFAKMDPRLAALREHADLNAALEKK